MIKRLSNADIAILTEGRSWDLARQMWGNQSMDYQETSGGKYCDTDRRADRGTTVILIRWNRPMDDRETERDRHNYGDIKRGAIDSSQDMVRQLWLYR